MPLNLEPMASYSSRNLVPLPVSGSGGLDLQIIAEWLEIAVAQSLKCVTL